MTTENLPSENQILYDANDNIVVATSTLGTGHYFQVEYVINGTDDITQSWSRIDGITANINTRDVLRDRYINSFSPSLDTSFSRIESVIHRVRLRIKEYDLATSTEQEVSESPLFYIHKSLRRLSVSETTQTTEAQSLLYALPDNSRVDPAGVIRIPVHITQLTDTTDTYRITITGSDAQELFDQTFGVSVIGSRVFNFNLGSLDLSGLSSITVSFQRVGSESTLSRKLTLIQIKKYPIKTVVFMDNLGRYQYAYFTGQRETNHAYNRASYQLQDDSYITSEVTQEDTITIDTGYLNRSQLPLVNQVCNALEIYIKINNEFVKVLHQTTRQVGIKDNEALYAQELTFKVVNTPL